MSQDKAAPSVGEVTRRLADRIKPLVEIKGDVAIVPKDLAFKLEDESAPTEEETRKVQNFRNQLVPALQLAVGELAIDHMAANKEIESITCTAQVLDDEIPVLVRRNYTHAKEPGKKDSEMVTIHGHSTAGYTAKTDSEIKNVRGFLKAYAAQKIDD